MIRQLFNFRGPLSLISRKMSTTSPQFQGTGKLNGKVAIVTASTDGIGYAIARRLALDGASVMISSRKSGNVDKALDNLWKEPGIKQNLVQGTVCHVGKGEDRTQLINKTLEKFGGIDIFVSNAAINPHMGPALDCPESAWDKIFEVNVKAPFLFSQQIHPHLLKRNGGSIIFISSIAGFQPFQVLGAYSVSKTALLGLTKVLAQQLGNDKIRVNCVAPGIIRTKFSQALTQSPEVVEKMLEDIPIGRLGEPDDIAGIVSFLVSEDASFITGENYVVAGGQSSRL